MIEREKIEEIKRQTDIVGLISQYVPLKKLGKNYRGLCPFHSERNPSFYVSPEKGIYYCFGCKKGGNAINFLMEYEKLEFPEAVKRLAKNLGIEIDTDKGLKHKEIYESNECACQFYTICLNREVGKRGQDYLKNRSIDLNRLKDFRLGYAPASGGLITHVRQKGISVERLMRAGLVSNGREIFRDRIIFPIFSLSNRVIGFGGRGIDDNMQPKYLNSPETPIFKKGEGLYGLSQAKERIRSEGEAILVEGYFDLLSLYQHGIHNVCAPLGTALTEQQAMLVSRFAKKINILFDGDLSGVRAALRAIGLLINAQVDVYVTLLPEGSDPDNFLNHNSLDALKKLISSAPDFFHFYRRVVETGTVEKEITLIKDLIEIIANIQDPIRFDRYLKYISHVFDIPVEVIKREMNQKTKTDKAPPRNLRISTEERLMGIIINNREYLALAKETLKPEDFKEDGIKRIYQEILKNENFDIYDLSDIIDENLRERLLSMIMKDEPISEEGFSEAILKFRANIEKKKIMKKIGEAEQKGDEKARERYYKELDTLKRKMLKIDYDKATNDG